MTRAKKIESLDCRANALTGARQILQTRLKEVNELRDAALDWSDTEGVHDMRVATRRLRSALRDFKPHLKHAVNNHKLKIFDARLKTLARTLGAVRDLDVQIASLEKLRVQTIETADAREGIGHLIDERKLSQESKRRALIMTFEEINPNELDKILADALQWTDDKKHKADSYDVTAQKIISNSYQQVEKLSDTLFRPRAANRLHHLRIAAKRLRYAIELFAPCFKKSTKNFAKQIAGLQTSLGILHDCDVWLDELAARLTQKKQQDREDGKHITREALIWLLLHFADERERAFRDSLTRWNKWEHRNLGARLLDHCALDDSPKIDASDEAEMGKEIG